MRRNSGTSCSEVDTATGPTNSDRRMNSIGKMLELPRR